MKRYFTICCMAMWLAAGNVSAEPIAETSDETRANKRAQTELSNFTTNSTIDDYLEYAFTHNPALKAAHAGEAAKAAHTDQSGYLSDPALSFEYMLEQHDMQYRIGLTQAIPGFGKLRLKKSIAEAEANSAKHDTEALRLMVFEHVIKAFHNYHYLGSSLQLTDENIALLEDLETVLLAKYKTKAARYSDVLKVQVEKDKLLNYRSSLKEMREVMSAKLALLLDLPSNKLLPWPKMTPSGDTSLPIDVLEDMLDYLNPELKAMDSKIKGLSSEAKLARRNRSPDYVVGLGYHVMPETANGATPEDYGLMIGFTLPLWWGKNKANIQEKDFMLESATYMRKSMQNNLLLDLKKALFDLKDADRQIALLKKSLIPKAQQALEVTRTEFMSGEAQFMALIDAHRTLFDLSLNLARAEADREIALGEIGCCVGKYDVESLKISTKQNDNDKGEE